MGCNNAILGNGSRVYISDNGTNPDSSDFEEVLHVTSFTPDTPSRNLVDTPYLNQDDDFTMRQSGSISGAEITFTVGLKEGENNQGLEDLMTYLKTKECVSVLLAIGTDKDDTGEMGVIWRGGVVSQVALQGIDPDTPVTYSVTIAPNSLAERVTLPVTSS